MTAPAEIVIVCTGNIARSPFAAVLLADEAGRRAGSQAHVTVTSCGVHGLVGRSAVAEMRDEATARGLDLGTHRAAVAEARNLRRADLVITMTESSAPGCCGPRPTYASGPSP